MNSLSLSESSSSSEYCTTLCCWKCVCPPYPPALFLLDVSEKTEVNKSKVCSQTINFAYICFHNRIEQTNNSPRKKKTNKGKQYKFSCFPFYCHAIVRFHVIFIEVFRNFPIFCFKASKLTNNKSESFRSSIKVSMLFWCFW